MKLPKDVEEDLEEFMSNPNVHEILEIYPLNDEIWVRYATGIYGGTRAYSFAIVEFSQAKYKMTILEAIKLIEKKLKVKDAYLTKLQDTLKKLKGKK